jgi:cyanophycinase-like exopeptidase
VVILPTASAPDGPEVPPRWARMGVDHFTALGAQAEAVMALDREGCESLENVDAVRRADLVYFSGGKPDYLLATMRGSPLWEAAVNVLERGGVLAGCSAGAMILGGWIPGRGAPRQGVFWQPAFGLVPASVILPHFDEIPGWISGPLRLFRPRGSTFIGIPAGTALIGRPGDWIVRGEGTVRYGDRRLPGGSPQPG